MIQQPPINQLHNYSQSLAQRISNQSDLGHLVGYSIVIGVLNFVERSKVVSKKNALNVEMTDIYKSFDLLPFDLTPELAPEVISKLEKEAVKRFFTEMQTNHTFPQGNSLVMPQLLRSYATTRNYSDLTRRFGIETIELVTPRQYFTHKSAMVNDNYSITRALKSARGMRFG